MTPSILEFSQKCLANIDHDYLTLFDLKNGEKASFSTYPEEWCAHYLAQKYNEHDYLHLKNCRLPFAWGENITKDATPAQKKIFQEAQDFHIFRGITVPFSGAKSPGVITIGFNKGEKLPQKKILKLGSDLQFFSHTIITYKELLESDHESQGALLNLINEVTTWQKDCKKQKKKQEDILMEILADIRAAQLFIAHHETKDLGLETLHRAYKDIEKLF
jgi:hypothetical protein